MLILQTNVEGAINDAASIYAGAAAHFDYARRLTQHLPSSISWDAVRRALRNMQFYDNEYPNLLSDLARREKLTTGPIERFR